MRKHDLRGVNREWKDIDKVEERTTDESAGGFLGITAVTKRLSVLGKRLVGWSLAGCWLMA
jgi:hypothetical protein